MGAKCSTLGEEGGTARGGKKSELFCIYREREREQKKRKKLSEYQRHKERRRDGAGKKDPMGSFLLSNNDSMGKETRTLSMTWKTLSKGY